MKSPKFTLSKLALLCLPATLLVATSTSAQQHIDQASSYSSPVAATLKVNKASADGRKRYIVKSRANLGRQTRPKPSL